VDGDIARSVPIKIGAVGVSEVEIISGLNAGDTVIVSNTAEFNNASSVLLRKE
jgi:HlyD family secretion protein